MEDAGRPIFRADAVRRYIDSREESVLPRLVSPRIFVFLWLLFGLLAAGGFVAWLAHVPVYASGPGVVVDWTSNASPNPDGVGVVAFVPPEHLPRLRAGQPLFLELGDGRERVRTPIVAVEPTVISPEAARRRFALGAAAAPQITQPAAAAIARWTAPPTGLAASSYVGSVYHADIEVGSQRVISLVPLLGRWFAE
jgi:hypothetical protein